MATYRKELIGPGNYFVNYVGEDGEDQVGVFRVTPERIRHWYRNAKLMLSRGIQIPVPLEHGEERPITMRELEAYQTRNNAGWMRDIEVGNDGKLYGRLDITDPTVAGKIDQGSIGMTSPFFEPEVLTGDGTTWEDVISHVCLTNKPVVAKQAGFERMAVAASRRPGGVPALGAVRGFVVRPVRLSRAEGDDMPGDMEEDLTRGSGDGGTVEDAAAEDFPNGGGDSGGGETAAGAEETLELGAGKAVVSPELIDALASIGLYIPSNCTKDDLESMLLVAVQTALMQGAEPEPETTNLDQSYGGDTVPDHTDDDGELPGGDSTGVKPEEETMTVPLSRKPASRFPNSQVPGQQAAAPAKPGEKRPTLDTVALSRKAAVMEMQLRDQTKQSLIDRADNLLASQRCTPMQHKKFVGEIQTAKLSISPNGRVVEHSGIGMRLSMLEGMPAGAALSRAAAPTGVVEEDSPRFFNGANSVSPERAKQIADMQLKGRPNQ